MGVKKVISLLLCISMIVAPSAVTVRSTASVRVTVETQQLHPTDYDRVEMQIGDYYVLCCRTEQEADRIVSEYNSETGSTAQKDETIYLNTIEHMSWGSEAVGYDALIERAEAQTELPEVTVAVIDSGVEYTNPLLKERVKLHDYDFIADDGDSMDEYGHGTHVAGIIADNTPSNVRIASYRVADQYGNASIIGLIQAIKEAIDDGVDVINVSMGTRLSSQSVNAKMLAEVLRQADKHGIIIVAAAGNEGMTAKTVWPACYCSVVAVSALTQKDGKYVLADYSNHGDIIDFCAPGTDITSSYINGEYRTLQGTSMAAPFVTSAFAILKTYNNTLSAEELKDMLKTSAVDLGDRGYDAYYGYGMVSLAKYADMPMNSIIDTGTETKEDADAEKEQEPVQNEKTRYKITYNLNGGTASPYAPTVYISGQYTYVSPVYNPTRSGYVFAGWYFDAGYKKAATLISNVQTGDITLHARWIRSDADETNNPESIAPQDTVKKQKQDLSFTDRTINANQNVLSYKDSNVKLKAVAQTKITYNLISSGTAFRIENEKLVIPKGTKSGTYTVRIQAIAESTETYDCAVAEAVYTITIS